MEALLKHQSFFRAELEKNLNSISTQNSGEEELLNAIKYSLISKTAKYIRSFLIIETGKMLQCDELKMKDLLKIAFAIEMIHCYSLIHDDLPSMDNSDLRRGEPSLHKKFPESTALLAGNSLLTLAFKELSQINDAKIAIKIISKVADVSGIFGIMSGQVLDLNSKFKQEEFDVMNYHKTGKLIEICMVLPAILLEKEAVAPNLSKYGVSLGMAYQMQDDLLDEGEESFSYLTKYGSTKALKEEIAKEISKCENAISGFQSNEILKDFPTFLSKRSF